MSCNGYNKLSWYYTKIPQDNYKWTTIRNAHPRYVLVEYQPIQARTRCPCQACARCACQCPCQACRLKPAQSQPQPAQSQPAQSQPAQSQPAQSQSEQVARSGCGCSLD